jgi:hypothetical protein
MVESDRQEARGQSLDLSKELGGTDRRPGGA